MIVLDTQTLIWWVNEPEKISHKAKKLIEKEIKEAGIILVSSISIWEVYLLFKKGKIHMSANPDIWLEKVENLVNLRFIPVDNKIAGLSVNLPEPLHKDPADRIIIATARQYGATLITSDDKIRKYSGVQTIW